MVILTLLCLTLNGVYYNNAVKVIKNGLAAPEIVHSPSSATFKPHCQINAQPLDLIFVLDSSGSLKSRFQDEINIVRRIVSHVTIGIDATRVMLVQFSGTAHLAFSFGQFNERSEILEALDVLRHVSGITRIGGVLEFTLEHLKSNTDLRGANVPKLVFLLTDGRSHDYPLDNEFANRLRAEIPNLEIWAYGTGDYVALSALYNYTGNPAKIVTKETASTVEGLFDKWHGIEVCDKIPVCVRGSDKPLDLALLIDSSESMYLRHDEEISFAIERIVQNLPINPDAVRMSLITFAKRAHVHFKFGNPNFWNASNIIRLLSSLPPMTGITSTHLALNEAYELFSNANKDSGARPDAQKLVILMTDGYSNSAVSPRSIAQRLQSEGVRIIVIAMATSRYTNRDELKEIAGDPSRVFDAKNLQGFEKELMQYIGSSCPGVPLGADAQPRIRGATDATCDDDGLVFTVRTQQPMNGVVYAQQFRNTPSCNMKATGKQRELTMRFRTGSCGLVKYPSQNKDGYTYNITVVLQFHPLVITRADQSIAVTCFHRKTIPPEELQNIKSRRISDTTCTYRLHRYSATECAELEAKVGETLFHKWQCDQPPNYGFLVHDCNATSEWHNVTVIDANGCQVDEHILETPDYKHLTLSAASDELYVWQDMSVFMFPGDHNIVFTCKISFCDMESGLSCTGMIPPICPSSNTGKGYLQSAGFTMTTPVATRTLNVLESEAVRPVQPVKYCDIRT